MRSRLPLILVGAFAAFLDLLTKWWVFVAIPAGGFREIVADHFYIRPHSNPAGPWSWGLSLPVGIRRFLLPSLSIVAVLVLLRILKDADPRDRVKGTGFALILGGAVGNLWDRMATALDPGFGGVRDFLYFPTAVLGEPFPAFNLADTWITVGVVLVAWRILREGNEEGEGTPSPVKAEEAAA